MAPRRVLIVDDAPSQRLIFSRLLVQRGFEPMVAGSGAEALELLAKEPPPHLMLVDIAMPEIDGIALLKALRAHPATALIPVILMSGLVVPGSLMEAAAASLGVGPVFPKGTPFEDLFERMRRALESPAPAASAPDAVVIDPVKRVARLGDRPLPKLAPQRFQLLCALARTPDPVSREELLSLVWGHGDNLNVVDVTVARLRRDLASIREIAIETTPGGYRLVVAPRRRA